MSRVVIIGSQVFMVQALQHALVPRAGVGVFCIVEDGTDVLGEVRRDHPDVVVVDGMSEGNRAFEGLAEIRQAANPALLVVIADHATPQESARAVQAGALVCTWPTLTAAGAQHPSLELAEETEEHPASSKARSRILTRRERETLRLVAEGHTNARIARQLWVTEQTVKFHLTNIYRKLGVPNRTAASLYAIQHGLSPAGARVADDDAASSRDDASPPDNPAASR